MEIYFKIAQKQGDVELFFFMHTLPLSHTRIIIS